MIDVRAKSRHAKRLAAALCSTFVAAGAMAYATGGLQHHHTPTVSTPAHGSGGHGGGTVQESQAGGSDNSDEGEGAGGEGAGGGAGGAGTFMLADGASNGAYGPGEDHDGPKPPGFMPNGENGLMMLGDYAQRSADGHGPHNGDNNSEHTPGLPPGGLGAQDGDAQDGFGGVPFPVGGDGSPKEPDGQGGAPMSGGFGIPGFGGGGGGGYAGGGGGGGGGGVGGPSGPTGGSGDGSGPLSGPVTNPIGGDPQNGPTNGPTTGPTTGGDNPPSNLCVVTALNTCGQAPGDGGPNDQSPPTPNVGSPTNGQNVALIGTPVPEASTWLMMIVGFVGAGALLRAQRGRAADGTLA